MRHRYFVFCRYLCQISIASHLDPYGHHSVIDLFSKYFQLSDKRSVNCKENSNLSGLFLSVAIPV